MNAPDEKASPIRALELAIARVNGNCSCLGAEHEHGLFCDDALAAALGIAQDEVATALEHARHEMVMANELVALREKLEDLERRHVSLGEDLLAHDELIEGLEEWRAKR